MTPNGYYSFERIDGTGWDGLVRVSGDGIGFDYASEGDWIRDQDLAVHFIDPGSYPLERIDDGTAQAR